MFFKKCEDGRTCIYCWNPVSKCSFLPEMFFLLNYSEIQDKSWSTEESEVQNQFQFYESLAKKWMEWCLHKEIFETSRWWPLDRRRFNGGLTECDGLTPAKSMLSVPCESTVEKQWCNVGRRKICSTESLARLVVTSAGRRWRWEAVKKLSVRALDKPRQSMSVFISRYSGRYQHNFFSLPPSLAFSFYLSPSFHLCW